MTRSGLVFFLALVLASTSASATVAAGADLEKLVECRADMAAYTKLATSLTEEGGAAKLGWKKIEGPNAFIAEYELPKPLRVFGGYKTKRIAFGASGILGVFDGKQVPPKALATKLGLEAVAAGSDRVMYVKTVKSDSDEVASIVIRLTASTITSHPGKTFAGCEYQVTVK
jgi:hypothetical protein